MYPHKVYGDIREGNESVVDTQMRVWLTTNGNFWRFEWLLLRNLNLQR